MSGCYSFPCASGSVHECGQVQCGSVMAHAHAHDGGAVGESGLLTSEPAKAQARGLDETAAKRGCFQRNIQQALEMTLGVILGMLLGMILEKVLEGTPARFLEETLEKSPAKNLERVEDFVPEP